jgi:hypothetical protein
MKNCFRYLKLMSPLKNIYLTLRSKVKVPRKSLCYATHRLMVMHPHTKYHWPIWKDKKVMVRTSFAEKKRKKKKNRLKQYVSLRLKGRHNYRMKYNSNRQRQKNQTLIRMIWYHINIKISTPIIKNL